MSSETPDVEITDVSKTFGKVRALDKVNLVIRPGQFFSLLGPSGCGKSTLLRLISGFDRPDDGRIAIVGKDVTSVPPNRRPTALVFQRWALFPHMTAAQNIAFGMRLRRLARAAVESRVTELLELVGLAGHGDRRPNELSGGQAQRVALARALAISPKVLLLDEPLSSLDMKLRSQMQLELKRLQREVGTTFLYVTHDQGEAMTMSDAIAVVNRGSLEQVGTPQEIYDQPQSAFVATFIGDTNLFDIEGTKDGRLRAGELTLAPPSAAPSATAAPEGDGEQNGDGTPRALSIRYERVRVGDTVTTANRFRGRVLETIFSGASVRYLVAVDGSDLRLFADVPHVGGATTHERGESVEVGWDADAAVVVAR